MSKTNTTFNVNNEIKMKILSLIFLFSFLSVSLADPSAYIPLRFDNTKPIKQTFTVDELTTDGFISHGRTNHPNDEVKTFPLNECIVIGVNLTELKVHEAYSFVVYKCGDAFIDGLHYEYFTVNKPK